MVSPTSSVIPTCASTQTVVPSLITNTSPSVIANIVSSEGVEDGGDTGEDGGDTGEDEDGSATVGGEDVGDSSFDDCCPQLDKAATISKDENRIGSNFLNMSVFN